MAWTSARASSEAVSGETDVLGNLSGKDKVLDLVGAIYDAALDVQNWPDVLNGIGMAAR